MKNGSFQNCRLRQDQRENERIVTEPFVRGTSSGKKMKKKFCEEFKHQDSCSDECCDGHGESWIESVVSSAAGYSSKADAAVVESKLVKQTSTEDKALEAG